METKSSLATDIRNKGNKIFRSCHPKLSFSILKNRYNEAINLYELSLRNSITEEDRSKAIKNIAVCYLGLFSSSNNTILKETIFYAYSSIKYYLQLALNPLIEVKIIEIIKDVIDLLNEKETIECYIENLLKFKEILGWTYQKHRDFINIKLGKKYLLLGINLHEKCDYIKASYNFNHSLQFLREAYFENKDETIEDLIESAEFLYVRNKAYVCIKSGEKLLSEAFYEDDSVHMDSFFDSIDKFREAYSIITSNISEKQTPDIELEAIICSKLGYLYFKVLKLYEKAQTLLKHSVMLGLSLHPKNVSIEDWYKKASNSLQSIRDILIKQENEEQRKIKEEYINELKDTIKSIEDEFNNDNNDNKEEFLTFIINTHKPTEDLIFDVKEEIKKSSIKRVLVKIIAFYHPDKVSKTDMKKKILHEEIAKILNNFYSLVK